MVRIQVKHGGEIQTEHEFLYDCEVVCQIDDIANQILQICNLQVKITRLVPEIEPRVLSFHGNPKAVPLIRALSEAKSYASKDQVLYNKAISYNVLRDHVQALEREVMENCQLLGFENVSQVQQLLTDVEPYQDETTQLHWAGKQLMRDKKLCDYIGMNDKTKIVLRLQRPMPNAV
ncbi:Cilia- and flagella-associated protein 298 [Euphorbia peplus]|nr:Cilia- and flagella-associated protein 298 [Euphorbia peplus]